jgi:hypothetical protein
VAIQESFGTLPFSWIAHMGKGSVKGLGMARMRLRPLSPDLIRIAMTSVVKGRGRLPDRASYFPAIPEAAAA